MAYNRLLFRELMPYPLMPFALQGEFMAGHADGIRNHLSQNLIILKRGKIKLIKPKILLAV
jgi:hypothetical protein